ncbi:MAG: low molecular weight protein-tyrosine-phosphatase [Arenicella sp.]
MTTQESTKLYKLLFVCMGNICRSPTAHAMMQHKVNERDLTASFVIESAGTHAYHVGETPDQRSQETAKLRGIDMSNIRAQKIAITDHEFYDLILVMDRENLELVNYNAPEGGQAEVRLLMEFAHGFAGVTEVPDPYYGGAQGFERVFDLVDNACDGLIDYLLNNTDRYDG